MEAASFSDPKRAELPPMLRQYLEYKDKYPDCLLLFQVGDFYELFFEDAITVSKTLNLTLTSRDKKNPDPVPMCGVPVAVIDSYAERLVDAGYSVAIVSQQDAVQKPGVAVTRQLERILTPGIRILASSQSTESEPSVAAIVTSSERVFGIAVSNVQSGVLRVIEDIPLAELYNEIAKVSPSEIVILAHIESKSIDKRSAWVKELFCHVDTSRVKFRRESSAVNRDFNQISNYSSLGALGRKAVRFLIQYVDETTVGLGAKFSEVHAERGESFVSIDANTRDNLEIVKNLRDGTKEHTLYGVLDRTQSSEGSRLLRRWLLAPLKEASAIQERLHSVKLLLRANMQRTQLMAIFRFLPDCERIGARMEMLVVSPSELAAIRDSISRIPEIKAILKDIAATTSPESGAQLHKLQDEIPSCEELLETIHTALVESPAPSFNEGEIIRESFDEELDRLRNLRRHGRSWITELEREEREKTGISSLKLRFNQAFGFFIEITRANLHKVPSHYIRKQTTVNGERFTTDELREKEQEILSAEQRETRLQKELFQKLRETLRPFAGEVRKLGNVLSVLDVLSAFAEVAEREGYVEPEVFEGNEIEISEGKHPVLLQILRSDFVPNSLSFRNEGAQCVILTGPNMGGKSTFLRQAALIVIMAQAGSFVPAHRVRIGVVDKIFARIGTSDNMIEGDSTFMVEMREAAIIARSATQQSLILIDEIGRGTATADGLALAQSILEWIIQRTQCRTLFATHFHELTVLEDSYPTVKNLSVGSVEKDGHLLFTHHIREGAASKSYGIEVAKLAGLPSQIIRRSKQILDAREAELIKLKGPVQQSIFDSVAFADEAEEKEDETMQHQKAICEKISALDVHKVTPLDALIFLNKLREELTVQPSLDTVRKDTILLANDSNGQSITRFEESCASHNYLIDQQNRGLHREEAERVQEELESSE